MIFHPLSISASIGIDLAKKVPIFDGSKVLKLLQIQTKVLQ